MFFQCYYYFNVIIIIFQYYYLNTFVSVEIIIWKRIKTRSWQEENLDKIQICSRLCVICMCFYIASVCLQWGLCIREALRIPMCACVYYSNFTRKHIQWGIPLIPLNYFIITSQLYFLHRQRNSIFQCIYAII